MDTENERSSIGKLSHQSSRSAHTSPINTAVSGPNFSKECEETTKAASAKEFEIEFVQGVSDEDKALSRRDKNAVDFVFNYSKLWCKACKDIVLALEKCAYAENEACRIIAKQFQALEASVTVVNGAPMKQQTISLARMMIEKCKEKEMHNSKRCRELLEVLTRQRTLFEKTRKYLKDKWKADVKRLLDAENILIKTKTSYYQRCQTGVKLREELTAAQNLLNDLGAVQASAVSSINSPSTLSSTGPSSVATSGSVGSLATDGTEEIGNASSASAAGSSSSQIAKQKVKVERLEKQLSENDKKEFEQMYAYREAVETANNRLYDLEKSKMEILADTRLTILKSDEVAKDSLAELFQHLFCTRMSMISQYETLAIAFQSYIPCSGYRMLIDEHIQKSTEYCPEKYQFAGFHEASTGAVKLDALPGRFLVRVRAPSREATEGGDTLAGLHSDSDSEEEPPADAAVSAGTKLASGSSNVLSSIVEFGSSFFRTDTKKSIRNRRAQTAKQQTCASGTSTTDTVDGANVLEKECAIACFLIARCVAAIEKQPGGLETHGIYRVPPSKARTASLMETLNNTQPTSMGQFEDEVAVLSQEHPLTLAGLVKSRLIALPEPLLTYSLYPNFVELGKVFEATEANTMRELVKRLQLLVNHLGPANRKLAGLLFHHLNRIASCQSENKMNSVNLGTMFAPTVLRQKPKFQVANMMEFVDNKGQTRVVEVMIDRASEIFGPIEEFEPRAILLHLLSLDEADGDPRRHSDSASSQFTSDAGEQIRNVTPEIKKTTSSNVSKNSAPNCASTTPVQHGLLRSATISATSLGRSALLGNPLPLYSPYRDEPRNVGQTKTDMKSSAFDTPGTNEPPKMRLSQLAEKSTLGGPTAVQLDPDADFRMIGSVGTSKCDASVSNACSVQSSSPMKLVKASVNQDSSVVLQHQTAPISSSASRPSFDKRGIGVSALSSLVVGRRIQPMAIRDIRSNVGRANKPDESHDVDLDECSFIDVDNSDRTDH